MTVVVFATDNESNVFAHFEWIVTLKNEAFVLSFHERKSPRDAGEYSPHALAHDLLESIQERQFFLIEQRVFRYGEDDAGSMAFLQLKGDVIYEKFVTRDRQAVLGIEVSKVSELVGELVPQSRIGQDFTVTVAFVSLYERGEECLLVVHRRSLA